MGIICKNDLLFFEMYRDWIDKGDKTAAQKVIQAFDAFMRQPNRICKKIQAAAVSTDFAQLTKDAFNVTVQEDNFDLAYEKAFMNVPLGTGQDSWEIYDVDNGVVFVKVEEGGRIDIQGMSGTKQTVYVDYYGGALGYTDKMIRFRKIPAMLSKAKMFRNAWFVNKANIHYALLAAGVGGTTTWQGVAADGELQRDIQTINVGVFTLADRCKDKGYGDTANRGYLMYANPLDKRRISAAQRATTANIAPAGRTGQMLHWQLDVNYTFNSSIAQGYPLVVLPGNKIQKAEPMKPTTYTIPKDPLTLNEAQSVWGIFGAAVADTDQIQKITLGS